MRSPPLRRRTSIVAWLAVLAFATPAAADDRNAPRTAVVTTNVVAPAFGVYYLETNLRASPAWALLVNASYFSVENDDWSAKAATVGAAAVYHWQGDALRRWYIETGSELLLASWRHEPTSATAELEVGFTAVAVVGYRWILDLGLVFDVAAGAVMLRFPRAEVQTETGLLASGALTRFYPAVKLNVGWAL